MTHLTAPHSLKLLQFCHKKKKLRKRPRGCCMRTLRHLVQGVLAGWVGPRALFLCETASVEGANQPSFLFNSPPLSVLTFLKLAGRRAIRSDILLVPIVFINSSQSCCACRRTHVSTHKRPRLGRFFPIVPKKEHIHMLCFTCYCACITDSEDCSLEWRWVLGSVIIWNSGISILQMYNCFLDSPGELISVRTI